MKMSWRRTIGAGAHSTPASFDTSTFQEQIIASKRTIIAANVAQLDKRINISGVSLQFHSANNIIGEREII